MEQSSVKDMELGNILFGHSRGQYHIVPREDYQEIFFAFMDANGFDSYGFYKQAEKYTGGKIPPWSAQHDQFENDTFVIRPYYWGEDEEKAELPNFVYKPTRLEIRWYKYPMRDAYCNQDISIDEFRKIVEKCSESMKQREA